MGGARLCPHDQSVGASEALGKTLVETVTLTKQMLPGEVKGLGQ